VAPEAATEVGAGHVAIGEQTMVATANQHATEAALAMLEAGGTAVDAALAAQLVLGLVEPQSSGIGGGAFLLHWQASSGELLAYDGRETAPSTIADDLFLHADGRPMDYFEAIIGGASVGVPGVVRMLALAHERHGRLPWPKLFEPAIALADEGFVISPRLHELLQRMPRVAVNPGIRAYFFTAEGRPRPIGSRLTNPAYADSLRQLAEGGPEVFYEGGLAPLMATAVAEDPNRAGALSLADLKSYRALQRDPVCGGYREYTVCSMSPPSSGGTTVLAMLGMLAARDLGEHSGDVDRAHVFAEASRLAFADRDRYVADPDFVEVPTGGLVDADYLAERAALIDLERASPAVEAGLPPGAEPRGRALSPELASTSHLSIVDARGNAVSMTTSIESAFGSRILAGGFLLNNQLTDFSFVTMEEDGSPVANRPEPGKRPRSSMAPTLVFDGDGELVMVLGSPGGSRIIPYVARVLWDVLDRRLDLVAAVAAPHVVHLGSLLELEPGGAAEAWVEALEKRGHEVSLRPQSSGLHAIQRLPDGRWLGVADPRREGRAAGY